MVLEWIYYGLSILLWLFLITMLILIWRDDFWFWLTTNRQAGFYLLGVEKLSENSKPLARKFYSYLAAGWTWILIWAWWLMPMLKAYFFKSISNELTLKVARISTLIVVISYAAVGFFAIAKALTIWYRNIYSPTLPKQSKASQ